MDDGFVRIIVDVDDSQIVDVMNILYLVGGFVDVVVQVYVVIQIGEDLCVCREIMVKGIVGQVVSSLYDG